MGIAELILSTVQFRHHKGWFVGKCKLCNDYKERAGFKIDGNNISYNCWNCSKTGGYTEHSNRMSKRFREILLAYSIDKTEIDKCVSSAFFNKQEDDDDTITLSSLQKIDLSTPEISLPKHSFKLLSHNDHVSYQEKLVDYLISRQIDPLAYPFYYSLEPSLLNRIIIPFYRDGKIIFWQARHIDHSVKLRYLNAPLLRQAVMFNMDKIHSHSRRPLFVTEGVFDAIPLGGIAVMSSQLSPAKIQMLKQAQRRLIFAIDKDKNGGALAQKALENGWEITFTADGTKDVSQSCSRFGILYTARHLIKNVAPTRTVAELAIKINCGV